MKLAVEEVKTEVGRSFAFHHHASPDACQSPFWHCHPELEIVYIPGGKGKRFIGNSVSTFEDGDFIVLGSYLPHHSFSQGFEGVDYEEYVLQIKTEAFLNLQQAFPELEPIQLFFSRARQGLAIGSSQKHVWGEQLMELRLAGPLAQLLSLLHLLYSMAQYKGFEEIAENKFPCISAKNNERIRKVYQLIEQEFMNNLSSRQAADQLAMTDSSFCRFFQQHTHQSFKQALTQIRMLHASRLLSSTQEPINQIAFNCGYSSVSLFNRLFKTLTKISPSAYRRQFRYPAY